MDVSYAGTCRLIGVAAVLATLSACGGTKVLGEPQPLVLEEALVTAAGDTGVTASLDWIIVRGGPGTWAKNADWDEYLSFGEHTVVLDTREALDGLHLPGDTAAEVE